MPYQEEPMTRLRTRILPALLGLALILPLASLTTSPAYAKAAAAKPAPTGAKVDLNAASQKELEALPGVGAATAKKIIAGRPYASVADLSKAGVSASTIQKITPLVTAGGAMAAPAPAAMPAPTAAPAAPATKATKAAPAAPAAAGGKIDLNSASQKELESLPKVGASTAKKIIAGRPYASVQDLAKAGVPAKTIETLTPLVTAGGAAAAAAAAAKPTLPRPAPAPMAPAAPAAPMAPASPAATASSEATPPTTQAVPPPAKGMVWVNLETKIFHREGDPWYGRTKRGQYMSEADALKMGAREAKKSGGAHPKGA